MLEKNGLLKVLELCVLDRSVDLPIQISTISIVVREAIADRDATVDPERIRDPVERI